MLKSLLNFLFSKEDSDRNQDAEHRILEDLKASPGFISKEDLMRRGNKREKPVMEIPKGKKVAMCCPELNNQGDLKIVEWLKHPGDILRAGDVICELEGKTITMEYESIADCKLFYTEPVNTVCKHGDRICIIEGI